MQLNIIFDFKHAYITPDNVSEIDVCSTREKYIPN